MVQTNLAKAIDSIYIAITSMADQLDRRSKSYDESGKDKIVDHIYKLCEAVVMLEGVVMEPDWEDLDVSDCSLEEEDFGNN